VCSTAGILPEAEVYTRAMALHIGLVGLGDAGRQHARALAELDAAGVCKWTAVCGRESDRVDDFCRSAAVPEHTRRFVDFEALLDAGLCDAVILATPDDLHAQQLRRCATRGVHALVEKPLATSLSDARSAIELARSCRTVVRVGYHLRHHRGHQRVKAECEALIGPIRRIDIHWAWPDLNHAGWRAQGRGRFWSLAALGIHGIDLVRWLLGQEPRRLTYMLQPPMAIDRAAELTLGFRHASAHIGVSIEYCSPSRVVIVGERGEIECLDTLGSRGAGEIHVRGLGDAPTRTLEFEPADPHRAQLEAFIGDIQGGEGLDVEALLGNLAVLETLDAGGLRVG
jgi:predicted dehydrogenase